MTTIVYDHKNKQIAFDSRGTANGVVVSDEIIKHVTHEGIMYFQCGSAGQMLTFAIKFKEMEEAHPALTNHGIFIENKAVYSCGVDEENIFRGDNLYYNYAVGTGEYFAIAALDHGKTAKEAVEYAITKDIYSGGKVHVYDIEKGDFI